MERLLNKLERRYGKYAVAHLALWLTVPKILVWGLTQSKPDILYELAFVPRLVLQGELWRLFSFLAVPDSFNAFFLFFELYLLYLFCNGLESHWGTFKLNVYLLLSWLATILSGFILDSLSILPLSIWNAMYLHSSIFLAFAILYPDFELLLFFILPVKVKYLALLTWLLVLYGFFNSTWAYRFIIIAVYSNYFLFFGSHHVQFARQRYKAYQRKQRWKRAMRD
jgi:hypothetical protein